jgi:hypothetical protein
MVLSCSIKEKLRTGEMHVRGDQWPYFLYADLAYDPDDPWNGLLRNQLLVFVSKSLYWLWLELMHFLHRLTSTSLLLRAL